MENVLNFTHHLFIIIHFRTLKVGKVEMVKEVKRMHTI